MPAEENVKTVQAAYAAFSRGEIAAILELLTDDVEWIAPGPPEIVPTAGTYRGKAEVGPYFATLGEHLDMHRFEPHELIAQGDHVVALIAIEATVKRTGRRFSDRVVHVWSFTDGKLARFEAFQDTAALAAAYS
jgi:ketosteroid isomerase-like protein